MQINDVEAFMEDKDERSEQFELIAEIASEANVNPETVEQIIRITAKKMSTHGMTSLKHLKNMISSMV